jgi:hypothetical protein
MYVMKTIEVSSNGGFVEKNNVNSVMPMQSKNFGFSYYTKAEKISRLNLMI